MAKSCDEGGVVAWPDLNHDVLFLVMMRLGVVDFVMFSGVCKSWRSLALSNKKGFMASRPPMSMSISTEKECCYLEDFEGRNFKTILPRSSGWTCVGLTCGYLVFYGEETHDFWLVNPITRHQLHFPYAHFTAGSSMDISKAILVFSPSKSGWVLVVMIKLRRKIWFSIAGKGAWNHVSTHICILDLHAFKGKIYILDMGDCLPMGHLYEIRLCPEPKLTLLETKNFPMADYDRIPLFVSSCENLFVATYYSPYSYLIYEFDYGEMKWVCLEETNEENAFFIDYMKQIVAIKLESWWPGTDTYRESRFNWERMWYFPHECVNVNLMDE